MPKTAKKSAAKTATKKTKTAPAAKKPAARKPAAVRERASAATPARVMTRRTGRNQTEVIGIIGSVTSEEIALKAYYLAERRRQLGLPGDPQSDWLQAERELRS